jgi:hypothetical protein
MRHRATPAPASITKPRHGEDSSRETGERTAAGFTGLLPPEISMVQVPVRRPLWGSRNIAGSWRREEVNVG